MKDTEQALKDQVLDWAGKHQVKAEAVRELLEILRINEQGERNDSNL